MRPRWKRMRRSALLLVGGLALFGQLALRAGPLRAAEVEGQLGPVTARVRIEPDDAVIGDPMTLTIEATAEAGIELLMPEFGEALDRFAIVDFAPKERLVDDGRTLYSQRYTLQAPSSGRHTLPSILIEFVDRRPGHDPAPEGRDAYELLTDPIEFEVASVLGNAVDAELAPPMGELSALDPGLRSHWPWLLATGIAVLAGLPFAWRAYARWRVASTARSANEIAQAELDALLARPRPAAEEVDPFFVELSSIVRRYLENRFGIRSPELTTERFLDELSDSPDLSIRHQSLLQTFLSQCDLVKFAHHIPTPESVEDAIDAAQRIIRETRPEITSDAPALRDGAEAPLARAEER